MKKQTVVVLVIAITLFAAIMLVAAAFTGLTMYAAAKNGVSYIEDQFSQTHAYEVNWGIDLPDGIRALYSVGTPPSFHGDGDQYNVYDVKNIEGIEEFIRGFSSGYDADMADEVSDILVSAGDDGRYAFDFDSVLWQRLTKADNSRLYIIFDVETGRLHLVERLM